MNQVVLPGELSGKIDIPSSKSQAHRLLICAALSAAPVSVSLRGMSQDILATCDCLCALGADIREQDGGLLVNPICEVPKTEVMLACRESGSTLRFLLPVCGMLGVNAVFCCEGRLVQRPLSPLDEELRAHGMEITKTAIRSSAEANSPQGHIPCRAMFPRSFSQDFCSPCRSWRVKARSA